MWKSIPLTLLWSIWKCRNDFVFSGVRPQLDLLSDRVKVWIALWVRYHHPNCNYTVHDLMFNWQQIRYSK